MFLVISVILPTHNREAELMRAVRSVYRQTELPNELIIVDDGSYRAVTTQIFANAPTDLKCILLRNETPKGANFARNRGISHATSDWIMFLDDDDQFVAEKVEIIAAKIQHISDHVAVISHGAEIVMPDLNVSYMANTGYSDDLDLKRELLLRNVVGSTSFATVKRTSVISAGLFWCELPALQDNELWLRLALANAGFQYISKPLTIYDQSMSNSSITKSDVNYQKAYQMLDERYHELYNSLCLRDLKRLKLYRLRSRLHRALLNGNVKSAFLTQLKVLSTQPSVKNIIMALLCLVGSQAIYKARSLIGKIQH